MSKTITLDEAAKLLLSWNNIEILTHQSPDGDTLGSGYALACALKAKGKNVRVITCEEIVGNFAFLKDGLEADEDFVCEKVVSVDVATPSLLGVNREKYENIIDLCLDHHVTNDMEATYKYVDSESAAAGEIVLKLIDALGAEIDKHIANCLYTAIATDTGCFKYSNTTGDTLRAAARLLDLGCDSQMINYTFFELTTRKRVELEKYIYDTMEFCCGGKCAVIYITCDIVNKLQLTDDDMGGIESIPRRIEGVRLGLTIKEKSENLCKISARTNGDVSANEFCKNFGGGGHAAAAGCAIKENIQKVREMIISKAEEVLNEGNC